MHSYTLTYILNIHNIVVNFIYLIIIQTECDNYDVITFNMTFLNER